MAKRTNETDDEQDLKKVARIEAPRLNYDIPFHILTPSAKLRDLDLVRWLNNKLGDKKEVWTGRQAASLLSREMLIEMETCFQALESHVKLKIVEAIPHLSYRLVEMWKKPLMNMLDLARRDPDDWLETIAEMYKEFPTRYCIMPKPSSGNSYIHKSIEDLRNLVRRYQNNKSSFLMPPNLFTASDTVVKTSYNGTEFDCQKHFTLVRRPKSSSLKAEVIKLAETSAGKIRNLKSDVVSSTFPIRIRSTARIPNNDLPMRGIQANTCKLSSGFTNEPRKFQRHMKREGGAKFIDINELPKTLKARRKEQEAMERSKKRLDKLEKKKLEKKKRGVGEKPHKRTRRSSKFIGGDLDSEEEKILETVLSKRQPVFGSLFCPSFGGSKSNNVVPTVSCASSMPDNNNKDQPTVNSDPVSHANVCDVPTIHSGQQNQESQEEPSVPTTTHEHHHHDDHHHHSRKRAEREAIIRRQCDEILADANLVNEEGRRMVTSFMSGNKENPYPALGDLITLKLSETYDDEVQPDGTIQKVRIETFFQKCNYCMDIRLLDEYCISDLRTCMEKTPDSLLYCLTIHEVSWTSQVNRVVRCLSHSDYSLTLQNFKKLLAEGSCSRRGMLSCDCPTCILSNVSQTSEPKNQIFTATAYSKTTRAAKINESTVESEWVAEHPEDEMQDEKFMGPISNQITEKPGMRTAVTQHSCINYSPVIFLYFLSLWYLC